MHQKAMDKGFHDILNITELLCKWYLLVLIQNYWKICKILWNLLIGKILLREYSCSYHVLAVSCEYIVFKVLDSVQSIVFPKNLVWLIICHFDLYSFFLVQLILNLINKTISKLSKGNKTQYVHLSILFCVF